MTTTAEVWAAFHDRLRGFVARRIRQESDREALELADVAGLGQGAVAERLGLSLSGAKSRVQRARLKLREVLQKCCEIELDRRGNPVAYAPKAASCSCDSCG